MDVLVEIGDFVIDLFTSFPDIIINILDFLRGIIEVVIGAYSSGNVILGIILSLLLFKIYGILKGST